MDRCIIEIRFNNFLSECIIYNIRIQKGILVNLYLVTYNIKIFFSFFKKKNLKIYRANIREKKIKLWDKI